MLTLKIVFLNQKIPYIYLYKYIFLSYFQDLDEAHICAICSEQYEANVRPRILDCGHSYCTACLKSMIENNTLTCPTCKKPMNVNDASALSVNYDLEKSIALTNNVKKVVNELLDTRSQKSSSNFDKMIADRKSDAQEYLHMGKRCLSQLKKYDLFLFDNEKNQEATALQMHDLAALHFSTAKQLKEEREKIKSMQKHIQYHLEELRRTLPGLDGAVSGQDVAGTSAKLVQCSCEIAGCSDDIQEMFPHQNIAYSQKVMVTLIQN